MLKTLSGDQQVRLNVWLASDRQWKREQRIGFARLMLKFAWAKEDHVNIAFWRAVIKANEI